MNDTSLPSGISGRVRTTALVLALASLLLAMVIALVVDQMALPSLERGAAAGSSVRSVQPAAATIPGDVAARAAASGG